MNSTPHEPYEGTQEYPATMTDWDDLMSLLCYPEGRIEELNPQPEQPEEDDF